MKKFIVLSLLLLSAYSFAADTKITGLSADTSPTSDDLIVTVDAPGTTPVNKKVTLETLFTKIPATYIGRVVGGSPFYLLNWTEPDETESYNLWVGVGDKIDHTHLGTGIRNVFVGYAGPGYPLAGINASDNTGVGFGSLWGNSQTGTRGPGSRNTALGVHSAQDIDVNGNDNIAIGYKTAYMAAQTLRNVFIGNNTANYAAPSNGTDTGNDNVWIGNEVNFAYDLITEAPFGVVQYATAVGASITAYSSAIALGYGAYAPANTFVAGGNATAGGGITAAYIGQGVTKASPSAVTLQTTGGSGTNNVGANLTVAPGKSTGSGTPASLLFATSTAGSTGTTLQSLSTRWAIDGLSNGDLVATGAKKVITTGLIQGGKSVIQTTAAPYTMLASNANGVADDYGGIVERGDAGVINLRAGAVGMNWCIEGGAYVVEINPNSSEVINLDGSALTGGYSVVSNGAAGDYICGYWNGTVWKLKSQKGTWASKGS